MKFRLRLLALCLVLLWIVALVPAVMAQENTLCANLSADDCTDLTSAFTSLTTGDSGSFALNAAYEVQPDDPANPVNIEVSLDGKFNGAAALSTLDVIAATSNPGAAVPVLINGLKEFSGELNLTAHLPPSSGMTSGEPLTLNLLLVNGVGYVDFSSLPASFSTIGGTDSAPKGWAGLDLIDVLINIGPNLKSTPPSNTSADIARAQTVVAKHLQYTRDGDTFTASLDLAGLFNDPDYYTMMGGSQPPAEAQAAIKSLKDATCQIVFTLADDTISEIQVTVHIPESTITAFNAVNSSPGKMPTSIDFNLNVTFNDLGEAQTISVPAGAPVTKFMEFAIMVNRIFTNMVNDLKSEVK